MATPSTVLETLERLSSKPGVLATFAMDRMSSTVLASTGTLSQINVSAAAHASTKSNHSEDLRVGVSDSGAPSASALSNNSTSPTMPTFDFASRIWQHVNITSQLVQDMDVEDDLKLLRLRTKRHEFMIVPDTKYIFVVVHEVTA